MSARDLAKLAPGIYLNDTLIEFYLKRIQSELPDRVARHCHFFSTFFYERLAERAAPEQSLEALKGPHKGRLSPHFCQAACNWNKVRTWTKVRELIKGVGD